MFLNMIPLSICAQSKSTEKKWFVGLNGGTDLFWGDIKYNAFLPSAKMNEIPMSSGLIFGHSFSTSFGVNTELDLVNLRGKQVFITDTLSFKAQALALSLKTQFDPIAFFRKKDSKTSLFFETGVGLMVWKSFLENQTFNDTINNLGWGNPNKKIGLFIPLGLKIEYRIKSYLSASFSGNYNFVFSDLLDTQMIGKNDSYTYTSLGIHFHFGNQKTIPKLLAYPFINFYSDTTKTTKENLERTKEVQTKEIHNPFTLSLTVPEKSSHAGFEIQLKIAKLGIAASGYFRLLLPAGFIPEASSNENVSFTKLGQQYEYDFILPMNQDSCIIQIPVFLSEIEKGSYPILLEGEIKNQKGNSFPIKFANYTEIITEADWNRGLLAKEKSPVKSDAPEFISPQTNIDDPKIVSLSKTENIHSAAKQTEYKFVENTIEGFYHIQILASRNLLPNLQNLKMLHQLEEEIQIMQGDGWYRYNVYTTKNKEEAQKLCSKVRIQNNFPQAFVVYYENGKRSLLANASLTTTSQRAQNSTTKPEITEKLKPESKIAITSDLGFTYRIEIAQAFDQPIPLYLLQNKVGKERVMEFNENTNYYYTIGNFEDLNIAKGFLNYVKTQFHFENAKIIQFQNNQRMKPIE
jgi:hypothetical protein